MVKLEKSFDMAVDDHHEVRLANVVVKACKFEIVEVFTPLSNRSFGP